MTTIERRSMMRHLVSILCSIILLFSLSACATPIYTCGYEDARGICEETVDKGKCCFDHSCYFCDNPISADSHYCEEHRCQFNIGYGRCDGAIITSNKNNGDIYCSDHMAIEDIAEFKEAKQVAATWCHTVAAEAKNSLFSPFVFEDGFYIDASSYRFDVREIDYPYRTGYVIVLRKSDGTLKCDGMRYY